MVLADDGEPSKPLFPVELKTFWAFPANSSTSLVETFLAQQRKYYPEEENITKSAGSSAQGPQRSGPKIPILTKSTSKKYRAVAQIYGYMSVNHMKYGLLSTYKFSFFFRRMDREDGVSVLEVSPPIPTSELMRSLVYVSSLAMDERHYTSPYTTPILGRKPYDKTSKFEREDILLSEINFDISGSFRAHQNIMKGKSLRFPDKQSVFKIFSYKEKGYRERFDRELEAYRLLDSSGAKIAPEFRGCYCANGMYLILELEDYGASLEGKDAKPYENQIRDLFKKLHLSGIIHNDVASRNLLVDGNGQVLLCDFGLAETKAEDTTEEQWLQSVYDEDEMVDDFIQVGEQEILWEQ